MFELTLGPLCLAVQKQHWTSQLEALGTFDSGLRLHRRCREVFRQRQGEFCLLGDLPATSSDLGWAPCCCAAVLRKY